MGGSEYFIFSNCGPWHAFQKKCIGVLLCEV